MSNGTQFASPPSTEIARIGPRVAQLRTTFESGTTRPLAWRREQLGRIAALVTENSEELLAALYADLRKPALEAWPSEIHAVCSEARAAARKLKKWTRPQRVATPLYLKPARSRIVREPLGVVLIIAPWNYPVQLILGPLIGAIGAGNCAILKPSEVTARTSAVLGRLVSKYLDPDAVAVIEGGVSETTALLAERFDHIFYTGSAAVGRVVMSAAAKHLTPVTLELGGKSPCIVDRDVDIEVAAHRIAWGKFMNAGQICVSPDYVLAHEAVEAKLIAALKRCVREFYGNDPSASPDFARVPNTRHHRRLAALLGDGKVEVGGDADERDLYVAPTILSGVGSEAAVMKDEIFGPILPILSVSGIEEAIAFVNARPKPLALYLFTQDRSREEEVVSRTSSGGVCINATLWQSANRNLPFGGVGLSGMGVSRGRAGFETFSHRKSVITRACFMDPKLAYPPFTKLKLALFKRLGL